MQGINDSFRLLENFNDNIFLNSEFVHRQRGNWQFSLMFSINVIMNQLESENGIYSILRRCTRYSSSLPSLPSPSIHSLSIQKSAFGSVPSSVLTQFVTLGNVLRGFGRITQSLYGVTFEQRIPLSGEMWDGAILKLVRETKEGVD